MEIRNIKSGCSDLGLVAGRRGRADDGVRAGKEPAAAGGQVRGPVLVARWDCGPQMQPPHRLRGVSWANNPYQRVSDCLGLGPRTSYRPSPGKCPNCTHVGVLHAILASSKVRVHTRLCEYMHGFPGLCPDSWLRNAALAIIWSPHQLLKPVHTHPSPGATSRLRRSRQDFACAKLQRILPRLHRLRSAESKIRSGQRGGTKRGATQ